MGKKFRRFSVIFTSTERAEERLPYDQWDLWGNEGMYDSAEVAKEEIKSLTKSHEQFQYFCTIRDRWMSADYHRNYSFNYQTGRYEVDPEVVKRDGLKTRVRSPYKFALRGVPLDQDFQSREQDRIAAGEYEPLEPYLNRGTYTYAYRVPNSDMISFFESPEKARNDRRTEMKASRYLRSIIGMDDDEMWDMLDSWGIATNNVELHFATSREKIRWVYENGPNSCMSRGADTYRGYDSEGVDIHPVEVYASPDLELAYLTRDGDVVARALCNANTKEFVRIYGDIKRMEKALADAGYYDNPMCLGGCRLLKIYRNKHRTELMMPYLDGIFTKVEIEAHDREYARVQARAIVVNATDTGGYVHLR